MIRFLIDECLSLRLIVLPADKTSRQVLAVTLAIDAIEAAGSDMINQLVEVEQDGTVTLAIWPFDGDNRV